MAESTDWAGRAGTMKTKVMLGPPGAGPLEASATGSKLTEDLWKEGPLCLDGLA